MDIERKRKLILLSYQLHSKKIKLIKFLTETDAEILSVLNIYFNRDGLRYCDGELNSIVSEVIDGNDVLTKIHLRINNASFRQLVMLYPRKRSGWSEEIEIIVTLFWLACGTSYRVVGATFNMPRSTVCDDAHRNLKFIVDLRDQIICLPNEENIVTVGEQFANKARSPAFLKAAGAIDCSHIRIKCPPGRGDEYINRKLFYSLQLQAVCDAEMKFIDVMTGYPGSVHDQRVLRNSNIYINSTYPPQSFFLIGDSGYQLSLNPVPIIIPFKASTRRPLTHQQRQFNAALSRARIVIEQAFGIMKTRWRTIFLKALELSIEYCALVIIACCVLHNICIDNNDLINIIDPEFYNDGEEPRLDENISNGQNAILFRDISHRRYFFKQLAPMPCFKLLEK